MKEKNKNNLVTLDAIDLVFSSINNIYLGFYKGNYGFLGIMSRLIKKWTKSEFAHCELILELKLKSGEIVYYILGASTKQGVRLKHYDKDISELNKKWVLFPVTQINKKNNNLIKAKNDKIIKHVYDLFLKTNATGYDLKGILFSNIFSRKTHNNGRYTCSEWCAELLDNIYDGELINPNWYSSFTPGDVYKLANRLYKTVELEEPSYRVAKPK